MKKVSRVFGVSQVSNVKMARATRGTFYSRDTFTFGQSLFELVIAIGISALIIVVMVSLVTRSLANATFAKNQTLAGRYAQVATEWLRGQRDNNIDLFITNATKPDPNWCLKKDPLDDASWSTNRSCNTSDNLGNTIFYRQVTFVHGTVSAKDIYEADIKVWWTDSVGIHTVASATNFSDWRQR